MKALAVLRQRLKEFGLNPADWDMSFKDRRAGLEVFELRSRCQLLRMEGWALCHHWIDLKVVDET